jgi:hypothetical protein
MSGSAFAKPAAVMITLSAEEDGLTSSTLYMVVNRIRPRTAFKKVES